jgi:hypothetical protein
VNVRVEIWTHRRKLEVETQQFDREASYKNIAILSG